jgi:transposase
MNELLRHRFGRRSERDQDTDNPQLSLFDDNDMPSDEPSEDETVAIKEHKRLKKRKKDTSQYPRAIEVAYEDKVCSCGCQKQVICYETKELYHFCPAEHSTLEQRHEVVACLMAVRMS